MVELVDELGFVERQMVGGWLVLEQVACAGHVEETLRESNTPRVLRGFHLLGLLALVCGDGIAHQHRGGAVELLGQFRIALAAEYRAGERVGVDEEEFLGREGEATARVGQLADLGGEADELGPFRCAQSEQAELHPAIDSRKQLFAVLDVVQADQPPVLCDMAEVRLGAVVSSNAGRHDEAGATTVGMDL